MRIFSFLLLAAVTWSVTYHDGSGNESRFWWEAKSDKTHFSYVPILPENSSSGTYHGGYATTDSVNDAKTEELRQWVKKLETDASLQTTERAMGTGAFKVTDEAGTREFIVKQSEALRKFDEFLGNFRRLSR